MKIVVFGLGYVGLSSACLLSQKYNVVGVDIAKEKVDAINKGISPLKDDYIEEYLKEKRSKFIATTDGNTALIGADYVIVATPTNYNDETNYFDTSIVESVIEKVFNINPNAVIIIKSTVPIGFTKKMISRFPKARILFSPEFLRESKALYDSLYPSRIIIGLNTKDEELKTRAEEYVNMLKTVALKKNIAVKYMNYTEAEAVKLFSNEYLALRVAYFNELDTYAEKMGLNTKDIIDGVCLDERIGNYYNNPSFGYGGYCLPKDTKQLKANFKDVPERIISAVVDSNKNRKEFIAQQIFNKARALQNKDGAENKNIFIGIYRLTMKSSSDNFRQSAIRDVISILKSMGAEIIIYEPMLSTDKFEEIKVVNNLEEFILNSDVIVANRFGEEFKNVEYKVYSRDIFKRD